MIKVFGIGNILLCDDGIGVKVIEQLEAEIREIDKAIQVIIGETDVMFCLEQIEKEDFIIIVDSTYLNLKPGTITTLSLEQCDVFLNKLNSQHEEGLLRVLRTEHREIKGYLIGVEIGKIEYSMELSEALKNIFLDICCCVLKKVKWLVNNQQGI